MQKQHGGELTFHANSKRVNEEQMWTRFIRITFANTVANNTRMLTLCMVSLYRTLKKKLVLNEGVPKLFYKTYTTRASQLSSSDLRKLMAKATAIAATAAPQTAAPDPWSPPEAGREARHQWPQGEGTPVTPCPNHPTHDAREERRIGCKENF